MQASEIVRNLAIGFGVILGALIGLPILTIVYNAGQRVKAIQMTAEATSKTMESFMTEVREILKNHEGRIREQGESVAIILDRENRT